MFVPTNTNLTYYEFILTENCNIRCKYCFDDYFSDRTGCSYNQKMTHNENFLDNMMNFIHNSHARNGQVTFSMFGGEPTMNWDYMVDLTERIEKEVQIPRGDMKFVINTNCLLLNSKRIDWLIDHNYRITVSIDGIQEAHDANRVRQGGGGTWEKVIKHLPEIMTKSKTIGVTPLALMVVNKNNYKYYSKSYEYLNNLGFGLNVLFDFADDITDEHFQSVKEQSEYLFIEKGYSNFNELNRIDSGMNNDNTKYCFDPNHHVSIAPDGNLYFCHQFVPKMITKGKDFKNFYGNIKDGYNNYDYINMINNRIYSDKFNKINKECSNCPALQWCNGGCLAGHYFKHKDYNKLNKTMCKMNLMFHNIYLESIKRRNQ